MIWKNRRESNNFEDVTGMSGGGKKLLGGGLAVIVAIVIGLLTGRDPSALLNQAQELSPQTEQGVCDNEDSKNQELIRFGKLVLASTEDVWEAQFAQMGKTYEAPKFKAFCESFPTACGQGAAAMGPFYCPADRTAYIDLAFCREMKERFNAPGDFAMAYVIAHEIGHHVQNLLGITAQVEQQRQGMSEAEANSLSVRVELQADFFAGVWAHDAKQFQGVVEEGEQAEALRAANAIGDDNLQKQAQGYIVPDAFTHGTSAQRMFWFKKGFETGDVRQGDTFTPASL